MYKTVKPATFTLPLNLIEDINTLSAQIGKKKTAIITEALEMYLDLQDVKLAKSRLEDKDDKVVKSDDFFGSLGI